MTWTNENLHRLHLPNTSAGIMKMEDVDGENVTLKERNILVWDQSEATVTASR